MERKVRGTYNYDNLARKYNTQEVVREAREVKIEKKAQRLEKNCQNTAASINSGIDFISMVVLSLAVVCMVAFGLQYLVVSSEITEMKNEVSALNTSYKELKGMNDEAYNAIDASVDIGQVYEVAVGELGMIFPSENQIVTYEYREDGYVRQYTSVPE